MGDAAASALPPLDTRPLGGMVVSSRSVDNYLPVDLNDL
jgi:hypothetical protein